MADLLELEIDFPLTSPCKVYGNVKDPVNLITEFLRCQIGAGADVAPAAERDSYHIKLTLDLDTDTFTTKHDCGNLGLRDGILMNVINQLDKRGD